MIEVWALYEQAWTPQTKTFDYISSLYGNKQGALEALKEAIEDQSKRWSHETRRYEKVRTGRWEDGHTWIFDDDRATLSIGKVPIN